MTEGRQSSVWRKRWVKLALGAVVSVGLLALLLGEGELPLYLEALRATNLTLLVLAVLFWFVSQFARTWRLRCCFERNAQPQFLMLLKTSGLFMLISTILPFRAGELSLPLLLKRNFAVPLSSGVGLLLLFRAGDLLVLTAIAGFLGGAMAVWEPILVPLVWMFTLLASLSLTLALLLPFLARGALRMLLRLGVRRTRVVRICSALLSPSIRLKRRKSLGTFYLSTMILWGSQFCFYAAIASASGGISIWHGMLAGAAATFSAIQPINGVAGFGVIEAGWALTLNALGTDWSTALVSGVTMHLVLIFSVALFAGIVWFWPQQATSGTSPRQGR